MKIADTDNPTSPAPVYFVKFDTRFGVPVYLDPLSVRTIGLSFPMQVTPAGQIVPIPNSPPNLGECVIIGDGFQYIVPVSPSAAAALIDQARTRSLAAQFKVRGMGFSRGAKEDHAATVAAAQDN